jgi:hypothetical protein
MRTYNLKPQPWHEDSKLSEEGWADHLAFVEAAGVRAKYIMGYRENPQVQFSEPSMHQPLYSMRLQWKFLNFGCLVMT